MIIRVSASLASLFFVELTSAQDALQPLPVVADQLQEKGFDEESLRLNQVDEVKELFGIVPGLTSVASDSGGFGDTIAIRGSANTLFFGPAGVGLTVDDLPAGDVFTYAPDLFEFENVQVLRGPQGSRFGRNAPGGIIVMNSGAAPTENSYRFSAQYGNYDAYTLRVKAEGALSDQWSYRAQGFHKSREGYIRNTTLNRRVDDRESSGVLANLFYHPTDDFELRFRLMAQQSRDGSQRLSPLGGDPFEVASDLDGATEIDRLQLSIHLTQDLGWAKFKAISAYQNWELGPNTVDLDFSPGPFATSSITQDQQLWSQELRLEGESWTAGALYQNKNTRGDAVRFFPTDPPGGLPANFLNEQTLFGLSEESLAFFANASWRANTNLTLTAGARLEYVDTNLRRQKNRTIFMSGVPPFDFPGNETLTSTNGWFFSPTIGASYDLDTQNTVFARSSIGVKPRGFTAFSDDPTTIAFDDERSWENEIGLRHSSENLEVELKGYYKQIDDYQLNRSSLTSTDFIVVNADEVTAYGIELEARWQVTEQLTVQASAGWNETEFERFTGPGATGDLSGNTVPFIPEYTASIGLRYDFGNGFFVQSSLRAIGASEFDELNSAAFRQGSYELVNAQVGYETEDWSAIFYGSNVFDEDHFTFINSQISAGAPGDPALFGLRFERRF